MCVSAGSVNSEQLLNLTSSFFYLIFIRKLLLGVGFNKGDVFLLDFKSGQHCATIASG